MKAMVVSPMGGRVPRLRRHVLTLNGLSFSPRITRRDLEAEEVAAYLTKLRSLVPDMPRKRRLSKLEVIQRVIEYICDLQTALEETNAATQHQENAKTQQQQQQQPLRQPLQPLLNTSTTLPVSTATSAVMMTTTTTTTTSPAATVAER